MASARYLRKIIFKFTKLFVELGLTLRMDSYNLIVARKMDRYARSAKMPKRQATQPTDRELEILKILWEHGPCRVRQVNELMSQQQKTGYTTTLKLMQIMADKGLVVRDESQFRHVYESAVTEEKTQRQLVGNLLDKAFSGSAEKLVVRALSTRKVSAEELAKIRELLDEMEGK